MYQREAAPPPELKSQIARKLRRAGFLRRRQMPWAIAAAVLIALLFLIIPRPEPKANYILLLYESPQSGNRAEYGAWAAKMRPLVVGGEELDDKTVVALGGTSTPAVAGYFLIHAPDDASAARVARECPHVRHGGAVALKRIVL